MSNVELSAKYKTVNDYDVAMDEFEDSIGGDPSHGRGNDDHDESIGLLGDDDGGDIMNEGIHVVRMDYSYLKAITILLLSITAFAAVTGGGYFIGVGLGTSESNGVPMENTVGLPIENGIEEVELPLEKNAREVQIANYIKGTALMLNIHITHHAGTFVCAVMKEVGPAPTFACMHPKEEDGWPEDVDVKKSSLAWPYNETELYVQRLRPSFHFLSQEFGNRDKGNLHRTFWEYENLVSMIVMRDPLERFLAGGKCGPYHANKEKSLIGDPTNDTETQALFWEYANDKCSDNYALKALVNDKHCIKGSDTSLACLESAKNLLKKFTFIIDQACLNDSLKAVGEVLHLNITDDTFPKRSRSNNHGTIKERLGNDTLYEFLQHRFQRDIELYQWTKTQSIVQCEVSA